MGELVVLSVEGQFPGASIFRRQCRQEPIDLSKHLALSHEVRRNFANKSSAKLRRILQTNGNDWHSQLLRQAALDELRARGEIAIYFNMPSIVEEVSDLWPQSN